MHILYYKIRCQTVLKLNTKNVKLKPVQSNFFYCKVWLHAGFLVLLLMELLCEFGKRYSTVRMGKMEKPFMNDKIQPDLTSMRTEKNIEQLG